jgi:2-hydroxychromene-2-carboxylate isomerase
MPTLDFFFEFASTYSYIAPMRIAPIARDAGVTVRWRPFLLGPIFKAQGLDTSPFNIFPVKGRYMVRDVERLCADQGLPFTFPEPFPQNTLMASRVALVGFDEGFGEDFTRAVYTAEFAERRNIGDPDVLSAILTRLGRDPQAVFAAAQSDAIKGRLRAQTEEAQKLDLFGAPTFVTGDKELFWGNDRLEQALKHALAFAKRTAP